MYTRYILRRCKKNEIGVGIGLLFVFESLVREFNCRNRRSTYKRFVLGVALAEVSAGFIYGFEEFKLIYLVTFLTIALNTILLKNRFIRT
ncbi:MAG: hypothetical protein HXS44_02040 [Theionarchaea archaeon]|nr:hypothetical protein [Theionarchaea archaeon]